MMKGIDINKGHTKWDRGKTLFFPRSRKHMGHLHFPFNVCDF
jgi:hypothetical protein